MLPGDVNLRPYSGDGVGPLAPAVTVATVSGAAVNRFAGADRIATAIATSNVGFPSAHSAGAVVVARSDDYPDSLVGATLAAARVAPLLFASRSPACARNPDRDSTRYPGWRHVYVLGGVAAVPASVSTDLTTSDTTSYDTPAQIASARRWRLPMR